MTLWDAYLLFLHRLGLGPYPFTEEGAEAELELPALTWLPRPSAQIRADPWLWVGIPLAVFIALIGQFSLVDQRAPYVGMAALVASDFRLAWPPLNRRGTVAGSAAAPANSASDARVLLNSRDNSAMKPIIRPLPFSSSPERIMSRTIGPSNATPRLYFRNGSNIRAYLLPVSQSSV